MSTPNPFCVAVEQLIGWLTVSLGLSLLIPNQSVPYHLLTSQGFGVFWWSSFFFVGGVMLVASYARNVRARLFAATVAFVFWVAVVGQISYTGSLSPTAWFGLTICAYLLNIIWRHVKDGRETETFGR